MTGENIAAVAVWSLVLLVAAIRFGYWWGAGYTRDTIGNRERATYARGFEDGMRSAELADHMALVRSIKSVNRLMREREIDLQLSVDSDRYDVTVRGL